MTEPTRCGWARGALDIVYHDEEWGVPVHEDRTFFEFLILEGAQAGLSWSTILNKRENYRKAFAEFDAEKVARFGAKQRERLLADAGIVRNQLKIDSAIGNAKAFLAVQEEAGSFDKYIWQFVDGRPIVNRFASMKEVPPKSAAAEAMSRDLLKRGFKFVGPTICYAYMQACGLVNDHLVTCFRHAEVNGKRAVSRRARRTE